MSILRVIAGLLLLLIPAGALYFFDRKTLNGFLVSAGRMVAQLLGLCLIVWGLLHVNSPWLNLAWLLLMAFFSAVIILTRIKVNVSKHILPVGIAQLLTALIVGLYLVYVVLPIRNGMDARWFVPIMALLLSHTTAMQIRGLGTYLSALKSDEQQYEFLRGNGTPHPKAIMPFVRRALLAVISPTMANLSTLGLFTMPLLLCGILLGGHEPIDAFVLMLMLTIACVASSVSSLFLSIWMMDRRLFDSFGKLLTLATLLLMVSCQANSQKILMYELPAPLKDRPEKILHRKGYTTSYNEKTKTPNWVAWHLTGSHTSGHFQRKQEMFSEDMEIPAGKRATDQDYYNSRYDRGHMCPAGDNKWDREAMTQSFLFTNICPQNHGLNKYEWNDLEILCREWAKEYGAIDIVCGPIYGSESQQKTIGRNKVWVPDAFFKVILCRQGTPKAIGFIYRNEGKKQPMERAVRTVDEVERLLNMDFFPALDDSIEEKVESKARLSDW